MIHFGYFKCYESVWFDLIYFRLQDRSAAGMEVSSKALQVSAPALLQAPFATPGTSPHLPMPGLTSAKMNTFNISFTSLQLPT